MTPDQLLAIAHHGDVHTITPALLVSAGLVRNRDEGRGGIRLLRRAGILIYDRMDDDPEYDTRPTYHHGVTSYRTRSEYAHLTPERLAHLLEGVARGFHRQKVED